MTAPEAKQLHGVQAEIEAVKEQIAAINALSKDDPDRQIRLSELPGLQNQLAELLKERNRLGDRIATGKLFAVKSVLWLCPPPVLALTFMHVKGSLLCCTVMQVCISCVRTSPGRHNPTIDHVPPAFRRYWPGCS